MGWSHAPPVFQGAGRSCRMLRRVLWQPQIDPCAAGGKPPFQQGAVFGGIGPQLPRLCVGSLSEHELHLSFSLSGVLRVRQEGRDGFLLERLVQIILDMGVKFVDGTVGRAVPGAEAVLIQTAVDPRRSLGDVDDLMEGDVLRAAAEGEPAAAAPLGGQDARLLQRHRQRGHHALRDTHLGADLLAVSDLLLLGEVHDDADGIVG